jgi:hypothetical protein
MKIQKDQRSEEQGRKRIQYFVKALLLSTEKVKSQEHISHTGAILEAFAKLLKAAITFVTCLSVRPYGTQLPLDVFS